MKIGLLLAASALALSYSVPASASDETRNSPTGGALPSGVTEVGGIVVDMTGTNDTRVVSQLAASELYRGYANFSENAVPGVATGNPLLFGTQTGYDSTVLDQLGGGIQSLSIRITLYDGDTAPGDFDQGENTLSVNDILLGNWSDVTAYQTTSDGQTLLSTTNGFGNDILATGFFSITDVAVLTEIYNSLLASNALAFTLNDVDPYDNYFDFTQGVDGGLIDVGTGPVVTPPTVPPTGQFLYWDGAAAGNADNGVVNGGDGVWDATTANWTEAGGGANGAYTPNPGSVTFAGTAGTVTVDNSLGNVAVEGMHFAVNGYHIVGEAIELSGTAATVRVGDGTADGASFVATIDAPLTGTAGLTKTDLGILVLGGENSYSGTTTVAGGTLMGSATSFGSGDAVIDAGASLIIDQAADATFANAISGEGSLFKTGVGTLEVTADSSLTGPTTVAAGKLQVNGSLATSPVTVGNGATLGGYGTVGGISAQAGSTVAPGGSIGTLSINGDYHQASGSRYAVELTSTGDTDLLGISGAATLDGGAQLVVTKTDAARYVLGKRYTVLTADGGVTGDYALSGDTQVSLFYNLVDNYDATHVYLDVAQTRSFASAGATPNQISAAAGGDSTSGTLHDAIGYLQSEAEARVAFDSISGEIHATVRAAALEDSRFIREAVNGRLLDATDPNALWFRGYGSWGRMKGDGNAARYDRDIGGFFLGYDMVRSGALRIGLLTGYSHSSVKLPARSSSAKADDVHLGAYVGIGKDVGFGARLGASYSFRSIKTSRTVAFTGFTDSLGSKYDIGIGQAFGELGYKIGVGPATIEPVAGLAYVHLDSSQAVESGGASKLFVHAKNSQILFSTLGARFKADLSPQGGTVVALTGSAAWRHASHNRDALASLAFADGDRFAITAPPIAKDVAAVDLGVEGRLASGPVLSLSYSGQIGDGLRDHGVKASLRWPL
ncbi:outer membrane autotransporter barrel domain-containing protein [Sphingobium sp. AP50]|uniref:autotransporter outer membrane beta-barrel domain-containing protein n=1 Tax=Sphingobium sp. AP50 TaxID=1884369 RepID=UPI0008C507E9|nr:autotransporter domain-containing protein [Sphingobium sp. AP50]SEI87641.1 outer membrane autotransporter barrel domain-containing protein [Sphingobium sp. AP50]